MVGVFGPKEVQRRSDFSVTGQLTVEFKFAPFACEGGRRLGPRGEDREAEELGLVLAEALSATVCLNKYPKSVIEVGVTVIEDDGGVVAASLTAAGLALAEAGIHLCDLVVGVKVGQIEYSAQNQFCLRFVSHPTTGFWWTPAEMRRGM